MAFGILAFFFLQDKFRGAFKLRNSLFEIDQGKFEEFAILRRLPGTAWKSSEPLRYFHFVQRPQFVRISWQPPMMSYMLTNVWLFETH